MSTLKKEYNFGNKGGRPLLPENMKRSHVIKITFNDIEFAQIHKLFEESEQYKSIASFIRETVITGNYVIKNLNEDRLKLIEMAHLNTNINGVGSNFNQLMKHINSKKLNYFTEKDKKDLANEMFKLNDSLLAIRTFLNEINQES